MQHANDSWRDKYTCISLPKINRGCFHTVNKFEFCSIKIAPKGNVSLHDAVLKTIQTLALHQKL